MPLKLAMLVVLSLYDRMPTQFLWNLRMFFVYMQLSREIPMHDVRFIPTRYGPWCNKIKKNILALEESGYISAHYTPILYQDNVDVSINNEFFNEAYVYLLTEDGRRYVKRVVDLYNLNLTAQKIYDMINSEYDEDTAFILHAVKHLYPNMIKERE